MAGMEPTGWVNGQPYYDTPPGTPGQQAPAQGAQPSAFSNSLDPFREALNQWLNPLIQSNVEQIGGIAGQFGQMAQGEDPLIAMQRARALEGARGQLARRGLGGSSVAMNELARIDQGFNQAALGQRNQALQTQAGLLGGQAGLAGEYAQNLLAEPTLQVAMQAARQAGQGGGGGKK